MIKTLTLLAILTSAIDPWDIGKINEAKASAKAAYLAGNYESAVKQYTYLVDSVGIAEEEVMLNLASSYFHLKDTVNTIRSYQPLTMSLNNKIKSIANQQIGVLNNREGKFEEALNYLKQAIKADPTNDDAKYNYEMIKKKLAEQKKKEEQEKKDQNKQEQEKKDEKQQDQKDKENKEQKDQQQSDQDKKDQEKKDQEKKENAKEQEKKDQENKQEKEQEIPPSVKDKLKDMEMSEEKAKMILEAMRANEFQYLQQNKRKATKPKDRNKPDW